MLLRAHGPEPCASANSATSAYIKFLVVSIYSAVFVTPLKRVHGLEPARYCYHRHLKPARLPIPPYPHIYFLFDNKNYFNIVSTKSQYLSEKNIRQKNGRFKVMAAV